MPEYSRRQFLSGMACGCAALATPWSASFARAAPGKQTTRVTADQALAMLKEGNAAFVQGACTPTSTERLRELVAGESPFAVIVACSDARTPPGALFNRGLGDLFIVRVAGNTVDNTGLGSIEYGVAVLGAPLVLVLGHTQCGAVEAAVKVVRDKAKFPGSIGAVVAPIIPAVRSLEGGPDLANRAVAANVQRVVSRLKTAKPIISRAVAERKLKVAGAVYDLASGKVDFGVTV